MTKDANRRDSFILRIWREGENQEWKGWAQHADSGESILLQSLDDLLPFIEQYTRLSAAKDLGEKSQYKSKKRPGLK